MTITILYPNNILKNIKSDRVKNSIEKCIQKRLKIAFSTLKWLPGFHLMIPPDSLESIDREYSVNQSKKIEDKDFCESCGNNLEYNPIVESFSKMRICMNNLIKLSLKTIRYAFFHIKSHQKNYLYEYKLLQKNEMKRKKNDNAECKTKRKEERKTPKSKRKETESKAKKATKS